MKTITILFTVLILQLTFSTSLSANPGLKKVLILGFSNAEKDSNYEYLKVSITDAVTKKLKERFAFSQLPAASWQPVAEKNFIFSDEYYTKTAAFNLGLLTKQDVVINGSFRLQKGATGDTITTEVRIFDMAHKKAVASFQTTGPADSRIWTTVDQIANQIADEARVVLPSKDEWAKSGLAEQKPPTPILSNVAVGARIGGGFYVGGLGERLQAELPAFSFLVRGNLPVILQGLAFQTSFMYMNESPAEGKNPNLAELNATTSNFVFGGHFLYDIEFGNSFALHPKLGGGYVVQNTNVTGLREDNFNNGIPYSGLGFDLSYKINGNTRGVLGYETLIEFDANHITYLNMTQLGINYSF